MLSHRSEARAERALEGALGALRPASRGVVMAIAGLAPGAGGTTTALRLAELLRAPDQSMRGCGRRRPGRRDARGRRRGPGSRILLASRPSGSAEWRPTWPRYDLTPAGRRPERR